MLSRPSTSSSSQGEEGGWERLSVEDDVESINSGFGEDQMTVGKEHSKGFVLLENRYIPLFDKSGLENNQFY
jgi:hypothetical protein